MISKVVILEMVDKTFSGGWWNWDNNFQHQIQSIKCQHFLSRELRNYRPSSGEVKARWGRPAEIRHRGRSSQRLVNHLGQLICRREQCVRHPERWPDYAQGSASWEKEGASQNAHQTGRVFEHLADELAGNSSLQLILL